MLVVHRRTIVVLPSITQKTLRFAVLPLPPLQAGRCCLGFALRDSAAAPKAGARTRGGTLAGWGHANPWHLQLRATPNGTLTRPQPRMHERVFCRRRGADTESPRA